MKKNLKNYLWSVKGTKGKGTNFFIQNLKYNFKKIVCATVKQKKSNDNLEDIEKVGGRQVVWCLQQQMEGAGKSEDLYYRFWMTSRR